jgi:predicted protein tyrosine phosphatase
VSNPNARPEPHPWFSGPHLDLYFGDVTSKADADQYGTLPPTAKDVRQAVTFMVEAWREGSSLVLVHCDHGASRSPALAYVAVAHLLGPGAEAEALEAVLAIRPCAVPNSLVVRLGDALLKRQGALIEPLRRLNRRLSDQLLAGMVKPAATPPNETPPQNT